MLKFEKYGFPPYQRYDYCATFYQQSILTGLCRVFPSRYLDNAIELWAFSIIGEYRGKGLGQQFLQEIITYYSNKTIVLFVEKRNERALHIYHKLGFKIVGEYRGGSHAWEMRLER